MNIKLYQLKARIQSKPSWYHQDEVLDDSFFGRKILQPKAIKMNRTNGQNENEYPIIENRTNFFFIMM
jgi:hypothetical protein